MNQIVFKDFFILLEEWKALIDDAYSDYSLRENAKSKIDKIISELHKPIAERDTFGIELLIDDLKEEKCIGKYVKSSSHVLLELCNES